MPNEIIHSVPGILSGTPIFMGTRLPMKTFVHYRKGDARRQFPSVGREQAIAALKSPKDSVLASACFP